MKFFSNTLLYGLQKYFVFIQLILLGYDRFKELKSKNGKFSKITCSLITMQICHEYVKLDSTTDGYAFQNKEIL